MSLNSVKVVPKDNELDATVIGSRGKIYGYEAVNDYHKQFIAAKRLKMEDKSRMLSIIPKTKSINIFADQKTEITEIYKSDLVQEIIDTDYQYFVAFCSFLYLVRALHLLYRVFKEIDENKLIYDFDYELAIFLVDIFFTVVLFSTALNGILFCWKLYSWFAFPYLMSLFFSTSLMGFRMIAPIIDKNYTLNRNFKIFSLNIFKDDRTTEAVLDSAFLLLNLSLSFSIIILYEQICEAKRAVKYEPKTLEINGKIYERTKVEDRIIYTLKKDKTDNQTNPK